MSVIKQVFFAASAVLLFGLNAIAEPGPGQQVIINDKVLSQQEVDQLAMAFGGAVYPGNYWYDAKTGGWGYQCGPGVGIGIAGLKLGGKLKANASCGNTSVFVNGRELPMQDLMLLQSLSGPIQPGRYWMDAQFNAGREGGPALVNYKVLAAQRNRGNAGGNDNFWSSKWGAGNSSPDGSQGYVNVPGHGPVGYGY